MERKFDSITKKVTLDILTKFIPFINRHETYKEDGDIFVIDLTCDFSDDELETISELTNIDYDDLMQVRELKLWCNDIMTQSEYEDRNLMFCPFCGSDDIIETKTKRTHLAFYTENRCENCGNEWKDIYYYNRFDITKQ